LAFSLWLHSNFVALFLQYSITLHSCWFLIVLKRQCQEKVGEVQVWGFSLDHNQGCASGLIQYGSGSSIFAQSGSGSKLKQNLFLKFFWSQIWVKSNKKFFPKK
jgi:hypothetical protein